MKQKTIWDVIGETGSIFREKDVFTVEYIPETYKYRDKQLSKMVLFSKERLDSNKRPYHLSMKGGHATGKTLTVKRFFNEVNERYKNVITVHVNCRNHRTEYEIYLKIYEKVFNKNMSVGGFSTFNIFNKILKEIADNNKIVIVALDDIEAVKTNKELNRTLYNLLRVSEINEKAKISVFAIANKNDYMFLENNVYTIYNPVEIEFEYYTFQQIHHIINERCNLGFHERVISDKMINDVAEYTYNKGDLRKGFHELYKAGENAEYEGSHKILKRHFN